MSISFMDKLLDGVQVEWKTLDAVFDIFAGGDVPKESFSEVETKEFNIPILSNGIGDNSLYGWTDKAKIEKASLTISARGTIGWTSYRERPFFPIVRLIVLTPKIELNLKFAYHFMKTIENSYKVPPAGIPQLTKPMLKEIKIPIPCPENPKKSLEIQAEIVRILDAFTAHTAELTTELTARKKQYNYYRDQLLSFEEGEVEWKTLGWIGRIVTGRTPKSSDKSAWGDEVDFVTPSDIKNGMRSITCPSRRLSAEGAASMPKVQIPSGSLLVTCIGADMGKTVINANDCIPNQQINAIILTDDRVQVGYLFHVLTAMRDTLRRQGELGGGTMPLINKSDFSKIVVPVPSLEEQARIVAILDKFDTLTNSISEGLPREIELRQKQYEYYRDLLLSFPKQEEEAA